MGWALVAAAEPHHRKGWLKRFDPRFWTVDFARPMMASVTSDAPGVLRVEAVFYRKEDLAGLIWEAEDRWDHPLLAYETKRDFRHTQLSFSLAVGRGEAARRAARADADDRGARSGGKPARLVCAAVELCRGDGRGCGRSP